LFVGWGWLGVGAVLGYAICRRLHLLRSGPFSVGFLNIWTVLIPHYLIYPAYLLTISDPRIRESTFVPTLQTVAVMFGGLLLGTIISSRADPPRFLQRERVLRASPVSLAAILGVSMLASMGIMAFAVGTLNPIKALSLARSPTFRQAYLQYNLSYPQLFLFGVTLAALGLLLVRVYQRGKRSDVVWGLVATAATATTMLAFGSRSAFFVPVILFLALTHVMKFRIRWSWLVIMVLIAIPIFVFIRILSVGYSATELAHRGLLTDRSFIGQEFIQRLNGFAVLQDFLGWFAHQSYAAGRTIIQMLVRWVPRPILPTKPPSTDVFLSNAVYGQEGEFGGGISLFGGAGEMYLNFGLVGMFLWFTLVGRLLYWAHYGTQRLVESHRFVAYALIFANPAIWRGIANMGINTIGTQQFLIWLAAELVLVTGLDLFGLIRVFDRKAVLHPQGRSAFRTGLRAEAGGAPEV
jgi:hypothetical protein